MNFEKPEDRKKEYDVIKKIAGSQKIRKLERSSLDYEIIDKAFIEIKCYNINHDKYTHTMVSIQKLVKMQLMSKRLPTFLFIQFNDLLRYINVNDIEGELRRSGRKPRDGSTNDIEFIGYVCIEKFKTFQIKAK